MKVASHDNRATKVEETSSRGGTKKKLINRGMGTKARGWERVRILRRINIKLTPRCALQRTLQRNASPKETGHRSRITLSLSLSLSKRRQSRRDLRPTFLAPPLPRFSELYPRLGLKRRYFHYANSNPSNDPLTSFQK